MRESLEAKRCCHVSIRVLFYFNGFGFDIYTNGVLENVDGILWLTSKESLDTWPELVFVSRIKIDRQAPAVLALYIRKILLALFWLTRY